MTLHTLLACRSDFSITESILKIKELVDEAARVGAKALALTDTMSVTGLVDFTGACLKKGIKPIIGCRLRLVDDPTWRKPPKKDGKQKAPPEYFVTWYVLSEVGLKRLYRLLTLANDETHFYNVPKLGFADFFAALDDVSRDDVAIATESAHSVVAHPDAEKILAHIRDAVDVRDAIDVFMTLTPVDTPYFDTINAKAIELANKLTLPTIVTRPALYKNGGADASEVMGAIYRNNKLTDGWHHSAAQRDLWARTEKELAEECIAAAKRLANHRKVSGAGGYFVRGLKATEQLVEMVKFTWTKEPVSLPVMAPDEFQVVLEKCKAGWAQRFSQPVFGHRPSSEDLKNIYRPRLVYELGVLKRLNFAGYFLLTEDVVTYAKSKQIFVGPGRGSIGGSLVAYLLGIQDCDPIRFELLFERFINPDRIDLPDADLDFQSSRRNEIFEYLIAKYGQARVAGVSNFLTLGPAASLRGVSKAFAMEERIYGNVSKQMPKKHGAHVALKDAANEVDDIADFRDGNELIWNICLELEGKNSTLGQHASGVVVGGVDLVERAVIERRKGDEHVVNWDKRQVEDKGLVKLDILGLEALDIMDLTLKYVRERRAKKINLLAIPLDDEKVLANFAKGATCGVFQFESGGMRKLLKDLGAGGKLTFDDITATTALYRPGPMESGMMNSFAKRKRGMEAVSYDHPLLEPILGPTFGVIVYQESVMQASRVLAGYSASDADKLRKIIGKKLPEEMKKERGKFVDGCIATIACDTDWAGALFDKIEGFAGYGFNKSHACAYAIISYQAMYLKTYFPVEYFAACLTLMKEDKLPALVNDAKINHGINLEIPDVNLASDRFEILTDVKLMIPFQRIKGLSDKVAKAIVEARGTHAPFKDLADFTARVNKTLVNVAKRAALDKIGSFASIEAAQLPSDAPSRIKDQRELIPGLITSIVPVNRDMQLEEHHQRDLEKVYAQMLTTAGITADGIPVRPYIGEDARFAIILDAPSAAEEAENMMFMSAPSRRPYAAERIQEAMDEAGVSVGQSYWTALCKRPKAGKQVSAEERKLYEPALERELAIVKPPIIVLMGSQTVKAMLPDFKGRASDEAGAVFYDAARDANLIIGFSPGELFHAPEKMENLVKVFSVVAGLIL